MNIPSLDPNRMRVFPLATRKNQLFWDDGALQPHASPRELGSALASQIDEVAEAVRAARHRNAAVMMTYGAHLVKNQASLLVRALIERGWVTHLATQGAGVIHDWEFAFQGATGESVRENAPVGRFGHWDETGRWINLAVLIGATQGWGFGESIGRMITDGGLVVPEADLLAQSIAAEPSHPQTAARADLLLALHSHGLEAGWSKIMFSHRNTSILAAAYQHGIAATVHPGIGYDIIVNHPFYCGAAMGRASETDVRRFAASVDRLDGGVYLSIGSAIMSPQVFEKAFSLVNNIRQAEGRPFLRDFNMVIVDLQETGGWDWTRGEPPQNHPAYYLRFCKSFHRMGGRLRYLQCDNRDFLLELARRLDRGPC